MADPNQDVVDAIFDSPIAQDATYLGPNDAEATPCRVIPHRRGHFAKGFDPIQFHGASMGVAMGEIDIVVRVSEVPEVEEGGVFSLLDPDTQAVTSTYTAGAAGMPDDTNQLVLRAPCSTAEPQP